MGYPCSPYDRSLALVRHVWQDEMNATHFLSSFVAERPQIIKTILLHPIPICWFLVNKTLAFQTVRSVMEHNWCHLDNGDPPQTDGWRSGNVWWRQFNSRKGDGATSIVAVVGSLESGVARRLGDGAAIYV
jgi:hypothetical protein